MAVPLSVPVLNLLVPILGVAVFTHQFHRLADGRAAAGEWTIALCPGPALKGRTPRPSRKGGLRSPCRSAG